MPENKVGAVFGIALVADLVCALIAFVLNIPFNGVDFCELFFFLLVIIAVAAW